MDWLDEVNFPEDGLIPAIAQDVHSKRVLMLAWVNRQALVETIETGRACYWSRSRDRLWIKGEESGHIQQVKEVHLDCDADVIIFMVEQMGEIACHTGRESCFFRVLKDGQWQTTDPVIKDPAEIYGNERRN